MPAVLDPADMWLALMSVAIANTFFNFSTMSSAAERAEARRKAILAKRGDRLAKLTTSARGEEGVYLSSDGRSN